MATKKTKRPGSNICKKCNGKDIHHKYRRKDETWYKPPGDYKSSETEHVRYGTYDCVAKKECLVHYCRKCGYEWTTDTCDAKKE